MRYVELLTGPAASVIGFGGAALLGRAGRKDSLAALGAAWDAGINFIDTARSYGYGGSEGLIGEFLQSGGRRDRAIVCTKFGIAPSGQQKWKQALKPVARAALKFVPSLRANLRRGAADQFETGLFSADALNRSFETSLRELKTDYVDLLIMHAAPPTALEDDELLRGLEDLVASGKVRMAGVSASHDVIARAFSARPRGLSTAQFAVNVECMDFTKVAAAQSHWFLVANHPFGGPLGVHECGLRIDAMRGSPALAPKLKEKLNSGGEGLMAEIVLNAILSQTGIHAVIPAMMQPAHLKLNVRAIEQCRFDAQELATLREELSRPRAISAMNLT